MHLRVFASKTSIPVESDHASDWTNSAPSPTEFQQRPLRGLGLLQDGHGPPGTGGAKQRRDLNHGLRLRFPYLMLYGTDLRNDNNGTTEYSVNYVAR